MIDFEQGPVLMGVVNVTPDSFSDGGDFIDPQAAIEHGLKPLNKARRFWILAVNPHVLMPEP